MADHPQSIPLMTEGEAKNHLCPASFNYSNPFNCKASGCMKWRWGRDEENRCRVLKPMNRWESCEECSGAGKFIDEGEEHVCGECNGRGKVQAWEPAGYCGL